MRYFFGLGLACLSFSTLAEESAAPAVPELHRTIVTATRTLVALDDILAPATVLGREDLSAMTGGNVADVLRFQAGIDVARNGGPGQPTSVFMRGAESNHTLVLVDGVRINPGTIGGAAVQNMSTELVEQMEIVRGPRSSLYGSDAIGGVINIVTRVPQQGVEMAVGGGRYHSKQYSVAGGAVLGEQSLSGAISIDDTAGFPVRSQSFAGIEQFPQIDRGYRNVSGKAQWSTDLGAWHVSAKYWRAAGKVEYLGFDDNFNTALADEDYVNESAAFELRGEPRAGWHTRLSLTHIVDDIQQRSVTALFGSAAGTRTEAADFATTKRTSLEWQNDIDWGARQLLTLGTILSRERASTFSFGSGFAQDTNVKLFYAQDQIHWTKGALLLAASLTDHPSYGHEVTWDAEYGLNLGTRWRLVASVAKAFRAPDATDRFSSFGGNPNLDPEISRNYELGLRFAMSPAVHIGLSAFRDDIRDLIDYVVLDQFTGFGENRNVARARIDGIELNIERQSALWRTRFAVNAQRPRDVTTGERLLRRADRSATASATRSFSRFKVGGDILLSGPRMDFGFPDPVRLGGYTLLNLHGEFSLSPKLRLQARLENALDRDYRLADTYRVAGRAIYAELRYAFH
jgi:vitamin B12 transporter